MPHHRACIDISMPRRSSRQRREVRPVKRCVLARRRRQKLRSISSWLPPQGGVLFTNSAVADPARSVRQFSPRPLRGILYVPALTFSTATALIRAYVIFSFPPPPMPFPTLRSATARTELVGESFVRFDRVTRSDGADSGFGLHCESCSAHHAMHSDRCPLIKPIRVPCRAAQGVTSYIVFALCSIASSTYAGLIP